MGLLGSGRRPGTDRPEVGRPGFDRQEMLAVDRSVVPPSTDPSAGDSPTREGHARAVAAHASEYAPPPIGFVERVMVTLSGVRHPIVAILLLISFFTVPSGKPLDGFLLAVVATALAWDAGMRAREAKVSEVLTGRRESAANDNADRVPQRSAWRERAGRPAPRLVAFGVSLAVIYSVIVGSFTRFSWPATFGVVGIGAGTVIIGWGGPTRRRAIPSRFARTGIIAWGSLWLAASFWELGALVGQPNFATGSYAHPTISTLTDPLLASPLGRSAALLGWVALGFFLVER